MKNTMRNLIFKKKRGIKKFVFNTALTIILVVSAFTITTICNSFCEFSQQNTSITTIILAYVANYLPVAFIFAGTIGIVFYAVVEWIRKHSKSKIWQIYFLPSIITALCSYGFCYILGRIITG